MHREYILPTLQLLLSVGASIVYFSKGDWRRGAYWAFAAGITVVITW